MQPFNFLLVRVASFSMKFSRVESCYHCTKPHLEVRLGLYLCLS